MKTLNKDFVRTYKAYSFLLVLVTCVLWGLTTTYNPHLDGVAVYRMVSSMPTEDLELDFAKAGDSNKLKNTMATEVKMMQHCMFPSVYMQLKGKSSAEISTLLKSNWTLGPDDEFKAQQTWAKLDFETWETPFGQGPVQNMPYNLPYDGLDANNQLNPQFFSPVCRCLNRVLNSYQRNTLTFDKTTDSLKACIGTRSVIQKQTLVGTDDSKNTDMTKRKYISRHALLFNLCFAIVFTMIYNSIEFDNGTEGSSNQWYKFAALFFIAFGLPFFSQCFSYTAVSPANSMQFSSLVHLPAAVIFLVVELMWGYVAKESDVRRQTYLHPYSFYQILVHLHVIALIENGVFTLEVILTFVLLSNIVAMAYAAAIFIAHGRLWQNAEVESEQGELKGYVMIMVLVSSAAIFHHIPVHPINSELNFLWILPDMFVVICFAQIVFLETLLDHETEEGEENEENIVKKLRFTSSVHLLNVAHTIIVTVVILYFAAQLHYTWYADISMTQSGGKLDKRLNFELAEMSNTPSYNNLVAAPGSYFRNS